MLFVFLFGPVSRKLKKQEKQKKRKLHDSKLTLEGIVVTLNFSNCNTESFRNCTLL